VWICTIAFVALPRSRKTKSLVPQPKREQLPAVCRAGFFQFTPQVHITNGCVQSRALFWCKSGRGKFVVNGKTYEIGPQDLYVLPWGRSISYLPSTRDPMYTAHVHIVPHYQPGAAWSPNVPHEIKDEGIDAPGRQDEDWESMDGVTRLHLEADQPVGRLIDFTVRWYRESSRDESEARALGLLLVRELFRLREGSAEASTGRPEELTRLLLHIDQNFHRAPSVKELALLAGRSRSHVLKLFRKHLGVSAKAHVLGRQLKEARELLLNTTLPISEVARRSGMGDPFHFSRMFRRSVGLPPRDYRIQNGPFSTPPKA
jgi:AraC-like DNA-binding protein